MSDRKKKECIITSDEICNCIPMSSEAIKAMTLNPYDQLFICRLLDRRDEAAKEELYLAVAEVVAAQNKLIFSSVEANTNILKDMAGDITLIKSHIATHDDIIRHLGARLDLKRIRIEGTEKEIKHIKNRISTLERKIKKIT